MSSSLVEVVAGPLVAGGDALVRREGEKVLFVDGALPGERVKVEITQDRKDLARGRVMEVLTPVPERIAPPCSVFRKGCGGCQWQHANAAAQHEYKVGIVVDALRRIAKIEVPAVRFAGAVPDFGYRTTLHLAVENGRAALRRRGTNSLVTLDECLIAHPLVAEMAIEGFFGAAKSVTLRAGVATGERLAFIEGDSSQVNSQAKLPLDVLITTDGRKAAVHEDVLGRRFRVSAKSFFQSGPDAAELLAATVDSAVPDDVDWVIDAYAGVGVLGAIVGAKRGCRITAIEDGSSAVSDANSNLHGLYAEVMDAEVSTVELPGFDSPDVVIADPARSGLGPSASRALARLKADRIVLVSCDPASLARDVNLLRDLGYSLNDVAVLDLFPQTHHVETVSVFDR